MKQPAVSTASLTVLATALNGNPWLFVVTVALVAIANCSPCDE